MASSLGRRATRPVDSRAIVARAPFRLVGLLVCLAVLALAGPAAANAPPLVGAATHPLWNDSTVADFDRELDLLAAAGANTVRIDIGWSTLEQNANNQLNLPYIQKADTFFAHARARNLKVIVTFFTTPCWASRAPETAKQGCSTGWWDRGVGYYPPNNTADFADAAAWVAQRWGDYMAAFEVWNEPNFSGWFNTPTPEADYVALLRAAYPRIKAVKPALPVIGPAMLASDSPFLERLYAAGIGGLFDGLSLRPFNQGRDPYDITVPPLGTPHVYLTGVPAIRYQMIAHGDGAKKMWFTELGWSSCAPGTSVWCITPDLQARYLADAFRIIRDRWDYVESVSVYNLRNKGTDLLDRETSMGLLYRDFAPKPSYFAFRDVLGEIRAQPFPLPAPPVEPPTPPRTRDSRRPKLTRLAVSVRKNGRALDVSYRLSERARVVVRLERSAGPRGCRRPSCRRWKAARGPSVRAGRRGSNRDRLTLSGIRPGRYRLEASARDRAGNRSVPRRAPFTKR